MKVCPFCAEEIRAAAIVCRHCGRDLDGPHKGRVSADLPRRIPASLMVGLGIGIGALLVAVLQWIP